MTEQAGRCTCLRDSGWLALVICLALAGAAQAGTERNVVINGEQITGAELEKLDRADCRQIPDGDYWLNRRSGTWGYAGDRMAQGRIGDGCRAKRRAWPKSRSIAPPASEPAPAGSIPEDDVKREEPITGTSPLLRAPAIEPEKP